jgi:hypothetical protein
VQERVKMNSVDITSFVDPKLFVTDPDPTFQRVSDPDPNLKSSGSGFGSDPKYLLFLQNYDFNGLLMAF